MGIRHKLFISYALLLAGVVGALVVGVNATLRAPLLEHAQSELLRELELGRNILEQSPGADPDSLARHLGGFTGHRVTVIAPDGTVLGDSGVNPGLVASLENHAGRPEVAEAFSTGQGTSLRFSTSVGADLLYAALTTTDGRVLRFAAGVEIVDGAVAGVRRQILLVGGVALLLAGLLSYFLSLGLTRPLRRMRDVAGDMARGDLEARVRMFRDDELGDLGSALDALAEELRRRLSQLEAEREEMTALIDAMVEGVLAVAPDGTLRRANPAARRIFGITGKAEGLRPEVIARRQAFLQLVDAAQKGEEVAPTEMALDDRRLLATAQPLPRGGAVLVFLDTTELHRLEGVRRDFVANASHELKTPLTVIRGNAETLLDEGLPPEMRRRFAESLRSNAERLQTILDDLLDLSRIESGGWTPEPREVALDELARHAWQTYAEAAAEKGVGFEVQLDEGARTLRADPGALHQVFSNLFSNALRYTPSGGQITVAARPTEGGIVTLEVRDTGTGIPAPHLGRIFERFYRVDPARSRAEGGTGLGLAIVRHLVERHGGRVEAESELGKGTTIRVTLPREPREALPHEAATES